MSFSCDVNVLLDASDASSPVHETARGFLKDASAGGDLFCLGWPTVMSYLRIATHPGIFSAPLSPGEALANIESLAALPHVRLLSEEPGFLEAYGEVAETLPPGATWSPTPTSPSSSGSTGSAPSTPATGTSGSSTSFTSATRSPERRSPTRRGEGRPGRRPVIACDRSRLHVPT